MRDVSSDYVVHVGDKDNYIVKAQVFSRDNVLCVAHALSVQFPNFPITVEEWRFVFSSKFLESVLFKSEVIHIPAITRKDAA